MRSGLAVTSRNDVSQVGVAQGGRMRVLFRPGGNTAAPGAPGAYSSSIWFSNNTNGMELKVVGTTVTLSPIAPMSTITKVRNPYDTIYDGRDCRMAVLRFRDVANTRYVEFGYDALDLPFMVLFTNSNGQAHRYKMNGTGTAFTITPYSFSVMAGLLAEFENAVDRQAPRDGYTVIKVGSGDTGATTMDALGVSTYQQDDPPMGAFLRPVLAPIMGGLRMRNEVGALVEVTAGAAGALTAALV
jgi:hypothetical protein